MNISEKTICCLGGVIFDNLEATCRAIYHAKRGELMESFGVYAKHATSVQMAKVKSRTGVEGWMNVKSFVEVIL